MKRTGLLLMIICLATIVFAQSSAKSSTPIIPKYLIDGRFYKDRPTDTEGQNVGSAVLKAKDGNLVFLLKLERELPERDKAYAIPLDKVWNGKFFLEESKKPQKWMYFKEVKPRPTLLKEGDRIGVFSVTDTEGKVWNDLNTLGKPLLLDFWQITCGPCIKEMPEMNTWLTICPNVNYFAVTWNTPEQIKPIVEKQRFLFRQIANDKVLNRKFAVPLTPTTIIVDKTGVIRKVIVGTNQQKRDELLHCLRQLEKE